METVVESLNLKINDDVIYGVNAPDFNDGKIKLSQFERTFYTCTKVEDNILVVGVSMVTGTVTVSLTNNDNIESQMRSGILNKKMNVIGALKLFDVAFNLLYVILKSYHIKIPQLVFIGRDNISINMIERIFRVGVFRTVMSKFRYKLDKFGEEYNQSLIYVLKK
jgi:hypothetical protein